MSHVPLLTCLCDRSRAIPRYPSLQALELEKSVYQNLLQLHALAAKNSDPNMEDKIEHYIEEQVPPPPLTRGLQDRVSFCLFVPGTASILCSPRWSRSSLSPHEWLSSPVLVSARRTSAMQVTCTATHIRSYSPQARMALACSCSTTSWSKCGGCSNRDK